MSQLVQCIYCSKLLFTDDPDYIFAENPYTREKQDAHRKCYSAFMEGHQQLKREFVTKYDI